MLDLSILIGADAGAGAGAGADAGADVGAGVGAGATGSPIIVTSGLRLNLNSLSLLLLISFLIVFVMFVSDVCSNLFILLE